MIPVAWGIVLILAVLGPANVAVAQGGQDVRVRWSAYGAATPEAVLTPGSLPVLNSFAILERRPVASPPGRQRNPELGADSLLVVAVDAGGKELYRRIVTDPRIIRAEGPGPGGEITGTVFHRATADFTVSLPDDAAIREIRLFQPRWTGTAWALDMIGRIPLP